MSSEGSELVCEDSSSEEDEWIATARSRLQSGPGGSICVGVRGANDPPCSRCIVAFLDSLLPSSQVPLSHELELEPGPPPARTWPKRCPRIPSYCSALRALPYGLGALMCSPTVGHPAPASSPALCGILVGRLALSKLSHHCRRSYKFLCLFPTASTSSSDHPSWQP